MLAAGAEGERLVARVRAIVIALLLITPTWKVITTPENPIYFWGFWVTVIGALEAAFVLAVLRWSEYRPWLGFVSSIGDVTFVSLALALFMLLGHPLIALNSKVTFEIYFLAITAMSLRYDRRICLLAGAVAVAQYAALNIYGALNWDLAAQPSDQVGTYSTVDQVTRLILMCAAVILSYALVVRGSRLLHLSMFDGLTGVSNRACFNLLVDKQLERARREGEPLAIAIFDADHFKAINDRLGHLQGDRVLVQIAKSLNTAIRRTDVLARFGGEEFVLAMPGVDAAQAFARVEKLRAAVTDAAARAKLMPDMAVTLSAGIAMFPEDGEQIATLVGAADARLLEAKRAGRNRTVTR